MNKEGASVSYFAEALLFICRKTVKASARQTQELTVEIKEDVKRGELLLTKIRIRMDKRGINPVNFFILSPLFQKYKRYYILL
ncbi:hypothetical protein A4R27_00135 [Priestia endophytica]|nr:hypothetical protein A4R27_00135 [Priestia endophytica]